MHFEKNEKEIRKDIESSISRCMNRAFSRCAPSRIPQEPDFVAELAENMPGDLYSSLTAYAPNYNYVVSGAFCHQKPLADFGSGRKPELGDLLLVYIEENKYSVLKCNAILLQAKKITRAPYIICLAEEHQLRLYEEWPTFKLERAGALSGAEINIQPHTLSTGAQYLLFQSPYKEAKKVSCAYADKMLVPEKHLSDQIIDLMKFFTGRTFQMGKADDDWSKMIIDLIGISGVTTFNRRISGRFDVGRQVSLGDEVLLERLNESLGMYNFVSDNSAGSCMLIYAREKYTED